MHCLGACLRIHRVGQVAEEEVEVEAIAAPEDRAWAVSGEEAQEEWAVEGLLWQVSREPLQGGRIAWQLPL